MRVSHWRGFVGFVGFEGAGRGAAARWGELKYASETAIYDAVHDS
jgi:hypothetical protein